MLYMLFIQYHILTYLRSIRSDLEDGLALLTQGLPSCPHLHQIQRLLQVHRLHGRKGLALQALRARPQEPLLPIREPLKGHQRLSKAKPKEYSRRYDKLCI